MKSVYQLLKEYSNRKKNPQYDRIEVCNNSGNKSIYHTISNLVEVQDQYGIWLEFDSIQNQKKIHSRIISGYVTEYHENIGE